MDENGIPKELFEKDPRIKPVEAGQGTEKSPEAVEQEVETKEKLTEEKSETDFGKSLATEPELLESKSEGEIKQDHKYTPVIEVEESLEKITSLPTIEAPPAQAKPSRPPRYFEFEEESGQLVKRENVYEPQSYAIPGAEDLGETETKPINPLVWLAVVIFLLVLVFLIYRFAF